MKIKIKIVSAIACSMFFPMLAHSTPPSDIAYFYGKIDEESVQRFLVKYENEKINILEIDSLGGAVLPAIELAKWVRKNRVTVRISFFCASACANYIFPAAEKKIINSPGIVMWHGSAEQKDMRELQQKHEQMLEGLRTGLFSSDSQEADYVRKNQKKYEMMKLQRMRQSEFFTEIGVDEAICRLGQEPIAYPIEWWTATTDVMKKFGINNVVAASDFGTAAYASKNIGFQMTLKNQMMSFGIRDQSVVPLWKP